MIIPCPFGCGQSHDPWSFTLLLRVGSSNTIRQSSWPLPPNSVTYTCSSLCPIILSFFQLLSLVKTNSLDQAPKLIDGVQTKLPSPLLQQQLYPSSRSNVESDSQQNTDTRKGGTHTWLPSSVISEAFAAAASARSLTLSAAASLAASAF